ERDEEAVAEPDLIRPDRDRCRRFFRGHLTTPRRAPGGFRARARDALSRTGAPATPLCGSSRIARDRPAAATAAPEPRDPTGRAAVSRWRISAGRPRRR